MTKTFRPDYLSPGTSIGCYVIHDLIGVGSGGAVYEVRSQEGNRFAMKVSRFRRGEPSSKAWLMDRRFTRSIVCLEELRGLENVAQLYAHDRYPDPLKGWQFYVQELVPGSENLVDWARRTAPSFRELANVFMQLGRACGEMAHADIRHRDLKPSNILMGAGGVPKIIDFDSAACFRAEELTGPLPSDIPGTLAYLSPELCAAILNEEEQNTPFLYLPTGDLHALGVIFYEVLTGGHPFDLGLAEEDLLRQIAYERPPRPSELNPKVPFALDDVVMHLLAKDPSMRYQNGDDLAAELKGFLEKVADESWDVPFQVGLPAQLALAPARVEEPARSRSADGARSGPARTDRRAGPGAWLAGATALLLGIVGLLVGSQERGSQSSMADTSGVPAFEGDVATHVDHAPAEPGMPRSSSPVPTEALAGTADAATTVTTLMLRASLITGPLPGQKLAPCDKMKSEVRYKGACWRIIYTERSCDSADIFEPVVGYCKKHRALYEPVYVEVKAKKPSSVMSPVSPDVPILQDRQADVAPRG